MMLLDHTCDIARTQAVGTNGRRQMASLYTGIPCLALPMNNTTAIQNQFSIGRAYDFYFADRQDVKNGDKLTWNGSTFIVKVVQPFTGLAFGSHIRTMCEQEIS